MFKRSFTRRIRPYVEQEIFQANIARSTKSFADEFRHLENAHVLGQASTFHHVKVHCMMLLWGIRQKNPTEVLGQVLRIIGALTKTFLGWVPAGNTGGSNISPFKPLPIAPELANKIREARAR